LDDDSPPSITVEILLYIKKVLGAWAAAAAGPLSPLMGVEVLTGVWPVAPDTGGVVDFCGVFDESPPDSDAIFGFSSTR
jgi:hypothetical protein